MRSYSLFLLVILEMGRVGRETSHIHIFCSAALWLLPYAASVTGAPEISARAWATVIGSPKA